MNRFFAENDIQLQMAPDDQKILAKYPVDFISFSYYMTTVTQADAPEQVNGNMATGGRNPYLEESDWGWQIDPVPAGQPLPILIGLLKLFLNILKVAFRTI
ncbi:hypothetical protein WP50_05910 [Lactiplantibacillus plantarum]|nr:hypothetical protein WP50_05910 [Lactiplantibacillus plantarum]